MKKRILSNRNNPIIHFILLLALLGLCSNIYAQDADKTENNLFKIGMDFGVSYINPKDVNNLFDSWYNLIGVSVSNDLLKGIHLGLSGTGYISITPLNFLEISPEYGYSYNPYLTKVDEVTNLDVKITNQKLGISVNFTYNSIKIGGGIYRFSSKINWKDDLYQFYDTWKGNTLGYDVFIGFNNKLSNILGFSFTFVYQFAVINELKNGKNQVLILTEDNKNFTLNLSGFVFRLGFYITF